MTNNRRQADRARPGYFIDRSWIHHCCDTRTPGETCPRCGKGPNDQPITHNQALASNA